MPNTPIHFRRLTLCFLVIVVVADPLRSDEPAVQVDVPYCSIAGEELKLDFYSNGGGDHSPLIVWVHGGAWRSGTKSGVPIKRLTEYGFSIASLDYRLSGTARFPAQTQDIKSAIRFLRANAGRFNIDPDRIVIAGASAGGHLAALVGVSSGVESLEDLATGNPDTPAHVAAIVSLYGAGNLETILSQSTPHGLSVREPALKLLLGDLPPAVPELAKLASPVSHVDPKDPPLLLLHGDQDPQMPINQSHELQGAYERAGLDVRFDVLHGAAHGGKEFYDETQLARMAQWIDAKLAVVRSQSRR